MVSRQRRGIRSALMGAVVLSMLLAMLPASSVRAAATFTVDSTADAVDAAPGDGICSTGGGSPACTLRAAIQEANAFAGADNVNVPTGVYVLTVTGINEDAAATGDLDITETVTIAGALATGTIIDGADLDRVLHVVEGVATVTNVTIRNGTAVAFDGFGGDGGGILNSAAGTLNLGEVIVTQNVAHQGGGIANEGPGTLNLDNSTVSHNTTSSNGGGIWNRFGASATITDSIVELNTAGTDPSYEGDGGGIYNDLCCDAAVIISGGEIRNNVAGAGDAFGQGGGIFNDSTGGQLTLTDAVVIGNLADSGGGISNRSDIAAFASSALATVITRATISDNVATGEGGGIHNQDGDLFVVDTTFERNEAQRGAGLNSYSWDGVLSITGSTFSGNTAATLDEPGFGHGGALFIGSGSGFGTGAEPEVKNSTLSGNIADEGCATYNPDGILRLHSVTVADNCAPDSSATAIYAALGEGAGTTVLKNTIVANRGPNCGTASNSFRSGEIASEGYNLADDDSCNLSMGGDVENTDPVLGPLADNGGLTLTHMPAAGSPAIDTGTIVDCPPTDQRGSARPAGLRCDKGSVEVGAGGPPPSTGAISGTKWDDPDQDGVRDAGEAAVAGVRICLFPTVPTACTFTDLDGGYLFTGLAPGTYHVFERMPSVRINTTPLSREVEVTAGETDTGIDFGNRIPPPPSDSVDVDSSDWGTAGVVIHPRGRPLVVNATVTECEPVSITATVTWLAGGSVTMVMTNVGGDVWRATFSPPFPSGDARLTVNVDCPEGADDLIFEAESRFIDPSGTIVDACTGASLEDADVTILKEDPYGSGIYVVPDPVEHIPADNPEDTYPDGLFAWDVVVGRWLVEASRSGYDTVRTAPFDIPPPKLGIVIELTPVGGCLPGNDAPVAVDDAYSTAEDTALTVPAPGVLSNDTDADGDPLTAILDAGPTHGSLILTADGSFTYTPNPNFNGTDTFTYHASDGTASSNIATVTIVVGAAADAPLAVDDAYATPEDTPLIVAAPGVLGNDTDGDGDPLTAHLVTNVSHGTLTLNTDGSFTYTPDPNFNGTDTFTYQADDGTNRSNTATVTIVVSGVNDAPIAINDAYSTPEDTPLTVAAPGVLGNDLAVDGDALTAELVSGPSHGTLVLNPNGSFTYTPAANFNGTDSFTYNATDGSADSNVATVTITVTPVNDAPTAVNDTYSTGEDTPLTVAPPGVLGNDTDPEGGPLTAVRDSGPSHGTLVLNADGSFVYTPNADFNGIDTFTYHASDGTASSNIATVTITVTAVNDRPVAVDDAYTTPEDTALVVGPPGVLGNDLDVDGNSLTAHLVSGPTHGSLTLNANGSFSYTPAADFNGTDSFTYQADDGTLRSNTATVTILVTPVDEPPAFTLDHFKCYQAHDSSRLNRTVTLSDLFGERTAEVRKLREVCNSADKNGEGISHTDAHLTVYDTKDKDPDHRRTVRVTNQFGTQILTIHKASLLMVPAAAARVGTALGQPNADLNHYQCYKVDKEDPNFRSRNVRLVDQWVSETVRIKDPSFVCIPVDKNDEGIQVHGGPDTLVYYEAKGSEKKFNATVRDQFGQQTVRLHKTDALLVPSTMEVLAVTPDEEEDEGGEDEGEEEEEDERHD